MVAASLLPLHTVIHKSHLPYKKLQILSGFRLSVRKWQKIPGCEFLRLSPYSQNCYVTEQVFDEPL